ncbi:MAG: cytochrome c, partial [Pseudomonadales bacterium]
MSRRCLAVGLLALLPLAVEAQDRSVWEGVYSDAQADQGQVLFAAHCKACHADVAGEVGGHGPAPAVFGEDFEFRWLDSSVLDILDTMRQTMPEAAPNSLSVDEYAALTAYILRLNGYPAGPAPLDPGNRSLLGEIYIEPQP